MKENILLVDDQPTFRSVLKDKLAQEGYKAIEVPNAELAVEVLKHKSIELVFISKHPLSQMSDIRTLKILNQNFPKIKTICLADNVQRSRIVKYKQHGANEIISKSAIFEVTNSYLDKILSSEISSRA